MQGTFRMDPLFAAILDHCLFEGERRLIVAAGFDEDRHEVGSDQSDDRNDITHVSHTEASVVEMATIAGGGGGPLYFVPSFTSSRDVSDALRQRYPALGLPEICLEAVLDGSAPNRRIGVLVPFSVLASRSAGAFRQRILADHRLDWAVFHGAELGLAVHHRFQLVSLIFRTGSGDEGQRQVTRFFRTRGAELDPEGVRKELARLQVMEGGRTQHGFVHRGRLANDSPITFEKYDPTERSRREELGALGSMVAFSDLVSLVAPAVHPVVDRARMIPSIEDVGEVGLGTDRANANSIGVVTGRAIAMDILGATQFRVDACGIAGEMLLAPGDICVSGVLGPEHSGLIARRVDADDLPLVAATGVHVLRPKPELTDEQRDVLYAFVRSRAFARAVRSEGATVTLPLSTLLAQRVPLADDDLELTLRSLTVAVSQFDAWRQEAAAARDRLFDFEGVPDARLHVLTVGRRVRQRAAAAAQVDDPTHRLRTRLPHPLAYRWRTVEAANPDLEGYVQLLECSEAAVTYVAILAIVLAQHLGAKLTKLDELARRLSRSPTRGIGLGDWRAIVTEATESPAFASLPAETPFYEVVRLFNVEGAAEALGYLSQARNDQAHGRGPKGSAISDAYFVAMSNLQTLLEALDFTTEYPLRYVESSRWDSIRGRSHVRFRELMGDHALTVIQDAEYSGAPIEAHSLYLVDRKGTWHLLRPLLLRHACPECGRPSTFVLDSVDKSAGVLHLKCLEDGHVHRRSDASLVEDLRFIGFLAKS